MGAIAERSRLQRLGRRNPQQLHHKRAVQRASGSEFPAERAIFQRIASQPANRVTGLLPPFYNGICSFCETAV